MSEILRSKSSPQSATKSSEKSGATTRILATLILFFSSRVKAGHHLIFYNILSNDDIMVIRILHEKMDIKRHFWYAPRNLVTTLGGKQMKFVNLLNFNRITETSFRGCLFFCIPSYLSCTNHSGFCQLAQSCWFSFVTVLLRTSDILLNRNHTFAYFF